MLLFFFKQKTAYEMRISDWSSDVCSSDLGGAAGRGVALLGATSAGPARCRRILPRTDRWRASMMHAQQMIRSHPIAKGKVSDGLVRCIEECYACAQACTACADACLSERRSEEHTSELQALMRISYAVFCLQTNNTHDTCN